MVYKSVSLCFFISFCLFLSPSVVLWLIFPAFTKGTKRRNFSLKDFSQTQESVLPVWDANPCNRCPQQLEESLPKEVFKDKEIFKEGITSLQAGRILVCVQLLDSWLTDNATCLRDRPGPTLFREEPTKQHLSPIPLQCNLSLKITKTFVILKEIQGINLAGPTLNLEGPIPF